MSQDILVGLIDPDPEQPRRHFDEAKIAELAQSMEAKGLAVSVLVRPTGDRFTIVHGERRWRAAKRLGWETIRAEVRDIDVGEARWLSLIENVQRQDLSPIEEARAFEARLGEGLTQAELGERIGKSQSYIAHKLRLLRMPEPLRFFVDREAITEGHARQLMKLKGIYPEGAVMEFDWSQAEPLNAAELETEQYAFHLLLQIRPEDNPVWNPALKGLKPVIGEACGVFYRYIRRQDPPLWAVGAFWWACLTIDLELSVVDLSKAIALWTERIYSAATWLNSRGEEGPPDKAETDWDWLRTHRYWGHRSDLRHAGLLRCLERDTAEMSEKEQGGWSAFELEALKWVLKGEEYVEPSSLQSWGETYKAHEERYRRATALERGEWYD